MSPLRRGGKNGRRRHSLTYGNCGVRYELDELGRMVTPEGFHLTGCDGKIDYHQSAKSSYSLYSDYYWYEIGDMICIGTSKIQYYCFPKEKGANVAKVRLAAEESYQYSTGHS